jgi:hypothetical protein
MRCLATRGCDGATPFPPKQSSDAIAPPVCPACGVAPAAAEHAAAARAAQQASAALAKLRGGAGIGPHHAPQLAALVGAVRSGAHARSRAVAEAEDALAEALAAAGDVAGAAAAAGRALKVLRRHYPPGSLPLAHEAAKVAQLIGQQGGDAHAAAELAREACAAFRAHYGDGYPRLEELQPLLTGA